MEIDPASLAQPDRYKLLIGGIVPRPIAFVSSRSPDGALNLAPFSFFAGVSSAPMALLFCPANGTTGEEKDTLRNVKPVAEGGTAEFVVNVASEPYIRRVVAAAEPLPYGESEFDLAGLTPTPAKLVAPPRVAESPIAFECRTRQLLRLAPGVPGGGNVVIGDVVHVYVRDDLINDRYHIDPARLAAVGRMGGTGYTSTRDRFDIPLGRAALEGPGGIAPGGAVR
jgi:flavin reductase (DIM6/NTAB) family NADH-FMN oxidoreductase RutF